MATAPRPDHHDGRFGGHEAIVPTEPVVPPSRDGSVVLDIGGEVGALVLHVDASLDGAEIDLFRPGSDHPYVHSAVRARHLAAGTRHAAVYPDLPAGEYVVAAHGGVPPTAVVVAGGRITEAGG